MRRIGDHSDVGRNIWPRHTLPTFEGVLDDCYTQLHTAAMAITRQLLLHASQQGPNNLISANGCDTNNNLSNTSGNDTNNINHSSAIDSLSYINSIFECSGSASTSPSQISQSNLTAPSQISQSTISGRVSMTNLTAFKYHVPKGEYRSTVHCPHHR